MELKPENFKSFLPLPFTLITTVDSSGIANAAPYACVMPILRPLDLIAIASGLPRDTLKNIRETNEFVVNVMGKPSFKKAVRCAKSYPPEVDELEAVGLEVSPPKKVSPPRVKDAVGWIEAVLEEEFTGRKHALLVGKVICSEINDRFLSEERLSEYPIVVLAPYFRSLGESVAKRDEFAEDIGPIRF